MSLNVHLRNAIISDADQIYTLIGQLENKTMNRTYFNRIFEQNLKSPDIFYRVLEGNEKIIGFVSVHFQNLLHHDGRVAEVQELCVDENDRGKGFGKILLDEAVLEARGRNCELIELAANKKREDAHRFYEREEWERSHFKFTRKL